MDDTRCRLGHGVFLRISEVTPIASEEAKESDGVVKLSRTVVQFNAEVETG
jgi:hypothetical protein